MSTKALLDVSDAAAILGVTRRRVLAMLRQGSLPTVQLPDGIVRFDEGDLRTWIEAHKVVPAAEQSEAARC